MSYSFQVRATTRAAAKTAVATKLAEVVQAQPVHAEDQAQAQAAADAFIDLVPEGEGKEIAVSLNGYLSGHWEGASLVRRTGACVGVTVSLADPA